MIVVVDDDVGFAEELQDLLLLSGFLAVVVVTHPHESSLVLLRSARLLILDLSLALTTALGVLNDLGEPGRAPDIVFVSGSGAEALEQTRLAAIEQGFRVLGALPKPVSPDVLLELIKSFKSAPRLSGDNPALALSDTEANAIRPMQILRATSLHYQGMFLPLDETIAPAAIAPQAVGVQRSLSIQGLDGFVVVTQLQDVLQSPGALSSICASADHVGQMSGKIVFDLGPLADEGKTWAKALGSAGFGVMARVSTMRDLEGLGSQPPVSVVAMRADLAEKMSAEEGQSRSADAFGTLAARSIESVCTHIRSLSDLRAANALGLNMISTFPAYIK